MDVVIRIDQLTGNVSFEDADENLDVATLAANSILDVFNGFSGLAAVFFEAKKLRNQTITVKYVGGENTQTKHMYMYMKLYMYIYIYAYTYAFLGGLGWGKPTS